MLFQQKNQTLLFFIFQMTLIAFHSISKSCGFNKIKLFCGGFHGFSSLTDELLNLIYGQIFHFWFCSMLDFIWFFSFIAKDLVNAFVKWSRCDAVLLVKCELFFPTIVGLIHCFLHALGYGIRIHNGFSIQMSGCSTYRLGE